MMKEGNDPEGSGAAFRAPAGAAATFLLAVVQRLGLGGVAGGAAVLAPT